MCTFIYPCLSSSVHTTFTNGLGTHWWIFPHIIISLMGCHNCNTNNPLSYASARYVTLSQIARQKDMCWGGQSLPRNTQYLHTLRLLEAVAEAVGTWCTLIEWHTVCTSYAPYHLPPPRRATQYIPYLPVGILNSRYVALPECSLDKPENQWTFPDTSSTEHHLRG